MMANGVIKMDSMEDSNTCDELDDLEWQVAVLEALVFFETSADAAVIENLARSGLVHR